MYISHCSAHYVVKLSYGRRSQVADTQRVSHIGLGPNFQPSLIWPTHILNYLYLKVQV